LSFTYVAPAQRKDGSSVVLKLGVPNDELTSEIDALRIYAGRGAVRLLESEADQGALLLERLQPGTMLSPISNDEQATRIAASVMEEVWRPEPVAHHFKTVADWQPIWIRSPFCFPKAVQSRRI